jgi:hypothetical protein
MADLLGEMLAGREWRAVREETGRSPTRQDFNFSALGKQRPTYRRTADSVVASRPQGALSPDRGSPHLGTRFRNCAVRDAEPLIDASA